MSLHEKPIVSIVIPNYNYGKWIEDAIDSVVDDDYSNKRIIVVDDGSTDGSAKKVYNLLSDAKGSESSGISGITGKYKETNVETTLIACNQSKGPSAARNIGIKFYWENTDVYSFLDSDDMHINGKLKESLSALIVGWGSIGAVYCDYTNFDYENNISFKQHKLAFCSEKILEECIMPSCNLVPKYVFEKIGFFDETMRVAEDWDLWIRMSKHFIAYHIPKNLSIIRTGSYNSTNTVSEEVWSKNWQRILEKIKNDK